MDNKEKTILRNSKIIIKNNGTCSNVPCAFCPVNWEAGRSLKKNINCGSKFALASAKKYIQHIEYSLTLELI